MKHHCLVVLGLINFLSVHSSQQEILKAINFIRPSASATDDRLVTFAEFEDNFRKKY